MTRFFCVGREHCHRSRNWMKLEFWRDIHRLTVTVSLLSRKLPRRSLIAPFQDPWYPTTIASLGVRPNETTHPMHRQFGHYPPLGFRLSPLEDVELTFP